MEFTWEEGGGEAFRTNGAQRETKDAKAPDVFRGFSRAHSAAMRARSTRSRSKQMTPGAKQRMQERVHLAAVAQP